MSFPTKLRTGKLVSSDPSVLSLHNAEPALIGPEVPLKEPPTSIFPFDCTATARIRSLLRLAQKPGGLNVGSIVPSGFNRARLYAATPFTAQNLPPTIILPSDWVAEVKT